MIHEKGARRSRGSITRFGDMAITVFGHLRISTNSLFVRYTLYELFAGLSLPSHGAVRNYKIASPICGDFSVRVGKQRPA